MMEYICGLVSGIIIGVFGFVISGIILTKEEEKINENEKD